MTPIAKFLVQLINEIQADASMSKAQAGDLLMEIPVLATRKAVNAYFDQVFGFYVSIGVINKPTWNAWRDVVFAKGPEVSTALLEATHHKLTELKDPAGIMQQLRNADFVDQLSELDADISDFKFLISQESRPGILEALAVAMQHLGTKRGFVLQKTNRNKRLNR